MSRFYVYKLIVSNKYKYLLAVLSIILGVSIFVSVYISLESAKQHYANFAEGKSSEYYESLNGLFTGFNMMIFIILVMGIYILYISTNSIIMKNRYSLGILKALGVSTEQLRNIVIFISICIGAVGGILGVVLGQLSLKGIIKLVETSINDEGSTIKIVTIPFIFYIAVVLGSIAVSMFVGYLANRNIEVLNVIMAVRKDNVVKGNKFNWINVIVAMVCVCMMGGIYLSDRDIYMQQYIILLLTFIGIYNIVLILVHPFIVLTIRIIKYISPLQYIISSIFLKSNIKNTGKTIVLIVLSCSIAIGFNGIFNGISYSLVEWIDSIFVGDYIAIYQNDSLSIEMEDLLKEKSVGSVYPIYMNKVEIEGTEIVVEGTNFNGVNINFKEVQTESIERRLNSLDEKNIAISTSLCETKNFKIGDYIKLPSEPGEFEEYCIVATFESTDQNGKLMLINYDHFNRMYSLVPPSYYVISLEKNYKELATEVIEKYGDDLRFTDVKSVRDSNISGLSGMFLIFNIIIGLVYVIGGISIVILMSRTIDEKQKQLSILKSLGIGEKRLLFIISQNALILGGGGAILGVITGVLMQKVMLDLTFQLTNIRIPEKINIFSVIIIAFVTVAVCEISMLGATTKEYRKSVSRKITYE